MESCRAGGPDRTRVSPCPASSVTGLDAVPLRGPPPPRAPSSGCRLVPPNDVNLGHNTVPEVREMFPQTNGTLGRASREPLAKSRSVRSPGDARLGVGVPSRGPSCGTGPSACGLRCRLRADVSELS